MNSAIAPARAADWTSPAMKARLARRYAAERRFRGLGLGAVLMSLGILAFLLFSMIADGWRGFLEYRLIVPVDLRAETFSVTPEAARGPKARDALNAAGLEDLVMAAAEQAYGRNGPDYIAESSWRVVRDRILEQPEVIGGIVDMELPVSATMARALDGDGVPEAIDAGAKLREADRVVRGANGRFLTGADATEPTDVGLWGAFKGSLLTMAVTLILAFPIGVLAAVYLEEFAPKRRWTDIIEVSINNLAAVPSIIFGLLGLAVFLNTFGLPRSAPLVGGLTLALMTMPVIVIAGRSAIKAVPPSIRQAALGIGASPIQVVAHHVVPAALPGILTGSIIGMARALGETAPLLMIGMRAFITTPPDGILSPASALPVQIFLWSDEVSRGFVEKTSAAILVLLAFLLAMNAGAVYLRNRFEIKW